MKSFAKNVQVGILQVSPNALGQAQRAEEPMPRYKAYNYDQLVMIPISLENQLEPGPLEYTINELVEKHIDLSVFEGRYQNDDTGIVSNLQKAV